jgi:hypothetical protein
MVKAMQQAGFVSLNALLEVKPQSRCRLIEQIMLYGQDEVQRVSKEIKGQYQYEHKEASARTIARLLIAALNNLQPFYSKELLCSLEKDTDLPVLRLVRNADIPVHLSVEYHYTWRWPIQADSSRAKNNLILKLYAPWLKVLCACNQWVLDGGSDDKVFLFAARAKIEADQIQSTVRDWKALNGSKSGSKKLPAVDKIKRDEEIDQRLKDGQNRKSIASEMGFSEATISRSIKKR